MPRISNAGQSVARGRDFMQDTAWHFRAEDTSSPQADEARRQMRKRAEIELEKTDRKVGKTGNSKKVPELVEIDDSWRKRYQEQLDNQRFNRGLQDSGEREITEGPEEFLLQPQERMTTRVGSITQPHLKSFQIGNGHQKRFSNYEGAHNLRHKEARAGRVTGERGAAIVATQQDLSRRGGGTGFLESVSAVDQDNKPNPENLEERERMTFADKLQAGWLELDGQSISRLVAKFDYEEKNHLKKIDYNTQLAERQFKSKLSVALDCLQDRSEPEFGPAIAQLIKLVEGFFTRNADQIVQ
ncbi:MAG: hypothetical protein NTU97_03140, partial [Candidatus Magasanikbacteria bacterium]|nr:hypothetical protein [Candidatus Magasanikbacteria bacterium]